MLDRGSVVAHVIQEMLDASRKVGERAPGMRQHDLQVRIFVERARINKFARQEGMLDGGVDPGGKRRRPGRPATAECVDYTIQLMKDDRIVQRLNPSKNRRK